MFTHSYMLNVTIWLFIYFSWLNGHLCFNIWLFYHSVKLVFFSHQSSFLTIKWLFYPYSYSFVHRLQILIHIFFRLFFSIISFFQKWLKNVALQMHSNMLLWWRARARIYGFGDSLQREDKSIWVGDRIP